MANGQRIVARTINEAAWCLEEGVVDSAATLDLAMALADQGKYQQMYARSVSDPNGFWAEQAKRIGWMKPPSSDGAY